MAAGLADAGRLPSSHRLPSHRFRVWRWSKLVGYALAAAVALESGARQAVTCSVALAPNAFKSARPGTSFPLPEELVRRGAVRFETAVGPPSATLVSWLIEPQGSAARGTVVLLHGVRMDRRSLVEVGTVFADAGYRSVLVDLRGHGESTGRYLTYGAVEAEDVSALLDGLSARGGGLGCVGAYGFSYGGAVALDVSAVDSRVRAVVAVAPFASLREVVLDYRQKYVPSSLPLIPDSWFGQAVDQAGQLAAFDPDLSAPLNAVSRSRAQQLLIHGSADTLVPLRHSRELVQAAGPRAQLLTLAGASHEAMPWGSVAKAAREWFDEWLPESGCGETGDPS